MSNSSIFSSKTKCMCVLYAVHLLLLTVGCGSDTTSVGDLTSTTIPYQSEINTPSQDTSIAQENIVIEYDGTKYIVGKDENSIRTGGCFNSISITEEELSAAIKQQYQNRIAVVDEDYNVYSFFEMPIQLIRDGNRPGTYFFGKVTALTTIMEQITLKEVQFPIYMDEFEISQKSGWQRMKYKTMHVELCIVETFDEYNDLASGAEIIIELYPEDACLECHGSGLHVYYDETNKIKVEEACPLCQGTGKQ